jgi:hypothetical protein
MSRLDAISPDLTVRQTVRGAPPAAEVLGRHPRATIDGRWALQSLRNFARDANLDLSELLDSLAAATGLPIELAPKAPPRSPIRPVMMALIITLAIGAGWGAGLLVRIGIAGSYESVRAASVHAHGTAQLWGWLALFVYAIGTHVLRQNTKVQPPRWLDRGAFASIAVGTVLVLLSQFAPARRAMPRIDLLAGVAFALSAFAYAASSSTSIIGRHRRPEHWHNFVLAASAWLLVWAVSDVIIRIAAHDEVPSDAARRWLITVPVLGFATNAIYGFGIRLIPGLLNLGTLRPNLYPRALELHNAGLVSFLIPLGGTRVVGAATMLAAALVYHAALGWLAGKPSRPIFGIDLRANAFVRIAFAWLVIGLAMVSIQTVWPGDVHHAYTGAWRHALTVGFVSTMVLGVGQRVVPIFLRHPIGSTTIMLASLVLITVGNAWRVGFELLTITGRPWTFRWMPVSGVLEVSAIALMLINIALTARFARRRYRAGQPIRPLTRVAEAIDEDPMLEAKLRKLGIDMFDDAAFVAPSMTFGALALAYGRDPEQLVRGVSGDSWGRQ